MQSFIRRHLTGADADERKRFIAALQRFKQGNQREMQRNVFKQYVRCDLRWWIGGQHLLWRCSVVGHLECGAYDRCDRLGDRIGVFGQERLVGGRALLVLPLARKLIPQLCRVCEHIEGDLYAGARHARAQRATGTVEGSPAAHGDGRYSGADLGQER